MATASVLSFYTTDRHHRSRRAPVRVRFPAGAMIYLVLCDIFPEALDHGSALLGGSRRELLLGIGIGVAIMAPMMILTG